MATPETMIERMARALCIADGLNPDRVSEINRGVLYWTLFADKARAVLTAMREPIIAALKPFADCAEELDGSQDTPRAPDGEWAKFRLLTDDYRRARDTVAMIDAALAE